MILSFDISTSAFSVALRHEKGTANFEIVHEAARSQSIVQTVDFMLRTAGLTIEDLEAVYAGTGPGSFTGIRIGLAFANALLQTKGVPLLGIPTLDLLAYEGRQWYNSAIAFIRSRKGEAYAAFYRGGRRESDYLALERGDLLRFIDERRPECLVCAKEAVEELGIGDGGPKLLFGFPRALHAVPLAREGGLIPGRQYLKPLYIRDSYAVPDLHRQG
jgi:tRNA threonylcarbamoyl adenosine modification protein YeaZ